MHILDVKADLMNAGFVREGIGRQRILNFVPLDLDPWLNEFYVWTHPVSCANIFDTQAYHATCGPSNNDARAALAVSPNNVPLRLHLADTLHEAGRTRQAVEECRAALKLDPNSAAGHARLGALLYELNDLEAALDHLQTAVRLDPKDARALLNLSRAESALGRHAEALMHLGAARALDPSLADKVEAPEPRPIPLTETGLDAAAVDGADLVSAERPPIDFDDVGGLQAVKEQVRLTIIYPFQRPELYAAYGKKAGGGILLYGPPGCGKTLLARATAGEVRAEFIYVGIDDVLDMYHGESERKLHAIFETARRRSPSVLAGHPAHPPAGQTGH